MIYIRIYIYIIYIYIYIYIYSLVNYHWDLKKKIWVGSVVICNTILVDSWYIFIPCFLFNVDLV